MSGHHPWPPRFNSECPCGWGCTQPNSLEAQRAYECHWQLIHGRDLKRDIASPDDLRLASAGVDWKAADHAIRRAQFNETLLVALVATLGEVRVTHEALGRAFLHDVEVENVDGGLVLRHIGERPPAAPLVEPQTQEAAP